MAHFDISKDAIRFLPRALPRKLFCLVVAIFSPLILSAASDAQKPLLFLGDKDYPPVAYLENDVAKGMDVDLTKALAAPLHRDVHVELMDWNQAQQKVLNGEADGLIGMSVSDERRKTWDFAAPTFTREFSLLVRNDEMTVHSVADLNGKRVGMTAGGFPRTFFSTQTNFNVVLVANYQEGLEQLTNGTIDAVAADLWVAAYVIEKNDIHGVTVVGKPFAIATEAIAVKKGNTALLNDLNRATLALRNDGTISQIEDNWRPQQIVFTSRQQVRNLLLLTGGIFLVTVLGAMVLWIFTLKRQIGIRRKIELALTESEAHYRNLTDAAFEGICISENGKVLDVNKPFLEMFGYGSRDEVRGKPIIEFVVPELRAGVNAAIQSEREEIYGHRVLRKDGSSFFAEARAKMTYVGGRTLRMTALRDVSDRKQAENLTEIQIQILEMITSGRPMLKTLDTLLHMIEAQSPEMLCSILLLDVDGVHIRHGAAPSLPEDYLKAIDGAAIGPCAGSCGTAAYRREPVYVSDIGNDPLWKDYKHLALPHGLHACWSTPIFDAQRNVLGTFAIYYRKTGLPNAWHGRLIEVAAHSAAICINKHKTDDALRESEEKFSKAFRTSPDVMSITDFEKGIYLEVNDAHEKEFGFKREEVIGRSPIELGIFENSDGRSQMLQLLKEKGRFSNLEIKARARNHKELTLLHSAELIELGGRLCVLRVSHDITERQQTEQALRRSEELFRAIVEDQTEMIVRWKPDGTRTFVNDAYCRMFGGTREQFIGSSFFPLISEPDREVVLARIHSLTPENPVSTAVHRSLGPDGKMLWQEWTDRAIFNEAGRMVELQSTGRDITDHKQAEAEREQAVAREQQARLDYTLQLIASQEAERARIAGELHDSLGQNLLLIKNYAQVALASKEINNEVYQQIEAVRGLATQSIAEARSISHDLHPYQINHLGLTRALDAMIDKAAQSSGIAFQCKLDNVDDIFSKDAATNLYRVVQESLNNILKHSRAGNTSVKLERDVHEVQLTIADDGCGFDAKKNDKGMGLKNIAERARILGGKLKVESASGKGTRIEIAIPISAEAE